MLPNSSSIITITDVCIIILLAVHAAACLLIVFITVCSILG
jgi:hypothetical protein